MKKLLLLIGLCASLDIMASAVACKRSDSPETPKTEPNSSFRFDTRQVALDELVVAKQAGVLEQEYGVVPFERRRNAQCKEVDYKPRYETWLSKESQRAFTRTVYQGLGFLACLGFAVNASTSEQTSALSSMGFLCATAAYSSWNRHAECIDELIIKTQIRGSYEKNNVIN